MVERKNRKQPNANQKVFVRPSNGTNRCTPYKLLNLLMLGPMVMGLAGCGIFQPGKWNQIVSSPEGTVTSYVQDSGILVYAPRSARAQKVIFDTPDQQLIHKPDTPFRKFFDSHAKDFADGKLEYAKTTILSDIVNMIRNKEFIREMIREVVEEHKDSAIAPATYLVEPIEKAANALKDLDQYVGADLANKNIMEKTLASAKNAAFNVAKAAEVTCWDDDSSYHYRACPDTYNQEPPINFFNIALQEFETFRNIVLSNEAIRESISGQPSRPDQVSRLIDNLLKILPHTSLRNKTIPLSQIKIDEAAFKASKNRNIEFLVNYLFTEFSKADYPNMREEEIKEKMNELRGEGKNNGGDKARERRDVWTYTTITTAIPSLHWQKQTSPDWELSQHLTQTLIEQRYFQVVVNKAIEKRRDLFANQGSPVLPLRDAQQKLEKFLTENVGDRYSTSLQEGKQSLWEAMMDSLNRESLIPPVFVQPGKDLPLTPDRFSLLSKEFQSAVVTELKSGVPLNQAILNALTGREQFLHSPEDGVDSAALTKRRTDWATALASDQSLRDAYERLGKSAEALKARKIKLDKSQEELDSRTLALESQKKAILSGGVFDKTKEHVMSISEGKKILEEVAKHLKFQGTDISDPAQTFPKADSLLMQAQLVYQLGKEQASCGNNQDAGDCPTNKAPDGNSALWNQILTKATEVQNELQNLNMPSSYQALFHAVGEFEQNPSISAKAILENSQNLASINNDFENSKKLDDAIKKLSSAWENYLSGLDESQKSQGRPKQIFEATQTLLEMQKDFVFSTKGKSGLTTIKDAATALASAPVKPEFEKIVATNTSIEAQKPYVEYDATAFKTQQESFAKEESKGEQSFLNILQAALQQQNEKMKGPDRLNEGHQREITKRTQTFLADARAGKGLTIEENGKIVAVPLSQLLTNALAIKLTRNVEVAKNTVATRFASTFQGLPEMVGMEKPILEAILLKGPINFPTEEGRQEAAQKIQSAFIKLWKTVKNDGSGTEKPVITMSTIVEKLNSLLDTPEISYLFGTSSTSSKTIQAFSRELYNAFKHRVPETVNAEIEADYSYWWLSFFPKAIPLGDERLEGQSTIEIVFPHSVTPEEQYHRWLQDRVGALCFGKTKGDFQKCPPQPKGTKDAPPNYRLMVQAATSVLNDFLLVLDSQELTRRYPNIRGIVNQAIAHLTDFPPLNPYENPYEISYHNAINYLFQQTQEEWKTSPPQKLKFLKEEEKPKEEPKAQSTECNESKRNQQKIPPWREGTNYILTFSTAYDSKGYIESGDSLKCIQPSWKTLDAPSYAERTAQRENEKIKRDFRKEMRERARNDLALDQFGVPHILFAVTSAAETQETLPFKIELYTNAFFDGSRRFGKFISESEASRGDFPKSGNDEITNFLTKNGMNPEDAKNSRSLLDQLKDFRKTQQKFDSLKSGFSQTSQMVNFLEEEIQKGAAKAKELVNIHTLKMEGEEPPPSGHINDENKQEISRWLQKTDDLIKEKHAIEDKIYSGKFSFRPTPILNTWRPRKNNEQAFKDLMNGNLIKRDLKKLSEATETLKAWIQAIETNRKEIFDTSFFIKKWKLPPSVSLQESIQELIKDRPYPVIVPYSVALTNLALPKDMAKDETIQNLENAITDWYRIVSKPEYFYQLAWEDGLYREKYSVEECLVLASQLDEAFFPPQSCWGLEKNFPTAIETFSGNFSAYFPEKFLERNPYLAYPALWEEESKLEAMREALRETVVNVFQTTYPGIPDPIRLKQEFSNIQGHLRTLVYQWLRKLWVEVEEENLVDFFNENNEDQVKRFRVLVNHFLDRLPALTAPSRDYLLQQWNRRLIARIRNGRQPAKNLQTDIKEWIQIVTSEQKLMDELSVQLVEVLYEPYWAALGKLSTIERHPVPFDDIQLVNFEEFSHWAKPHVQGEIQIIDLLPASRDDLVSMSINEGGAVANLAAQAEGAASYDLNKLRMGQDLFNTVKGSFDSGKEQSAAQSDDPRDQFDTTASQRQRVSDAQELVDRSSLRETSKSFGYSLGARAKGSVYARAQSALAYAKRREYLDAAITASGRGDNFAKWVVRPSDLRSNLAKIGSGTLVAAAHNGFPNGDQPFHLLVKVPNQSRQRDWNGKEYILFNSSYTATKRTNAFKQIGWLGLVTRGAVGVLNPAWWDDVEESIVGTVYPFKWNVANASSQLELLQAPNNLGGRLYLDETDKIKYSEVRTLVEAEGAFIKDTRSAQSGRLTELMDTIHQEEEAFRGEVREGLKDRRQDERNLLQHEREQNKSQERIQALQGQRKDQEF